MSVEYFLQTGTTLSPFGTELAPDAAWISSPVGVKRSLEGLHAIRAPIVGGKRWSVSEADSTMGA